MQHLPRQGNARCCAVFHTLLCATYGYLGTTLGLTLADFARKIALPTDFSFRVGGNWSGFGVPRRQAGACSRRCPLGILSQLPLCRCIAIVARALCISWGSCSTVAIALSASAIHSFTWVLVYLE